MKHRHLRALLLAGLGVCVGPAAVAQTTQGTAPPAKEDGLFRREESRTGLARQTVSMLMSVSAGHDDDLGADQGVASPLPQRIEGRYTDLDGAFSLSRISKRFTLSARAAGSFRHYPDLDNFLGSGHSAGAGLTLSLSRRTTLQANLDANYVNSFAFDTFARDLGSPIDNPVGSSPIDSIRTSYGGTTQLQQMFGRRSSAGVLYSMRYSEQPSTSQHGTEQSVTAYVGRTVARDTSFRVGYTYREGTQLLLEEPNPFWSHDLQATFEHTWRHAASRRTTLSFAGGPSLLGQRLPAFGTIGEIVSAEGSPRLFRVVGSVGLFNQMSRNWTAQAAYHRGAGLREATVFSNTASVDVSGAFGSRLSLGVSAGYTDGDVGLGLQQNRSATSFGAARAQVALSRTVAVYSQYFLYYYDYGTTVLEPLALRPLDRRGFRFGVTLWAPLQRRR